MGALSAAIAAEIGVDTVPRFNPDTATVGTSVVRIAPNNPNRFALLIVNLSAVAVYVKPANDVSASSGVRLAPNGGTFGLSWRDDLHLVGWDYYAIADAAASSILVMEVVAR